ncbi:hypothetical protein [Niallia circulans]|uniref:hypothetical protein n=1 Tax=Niallia circulans TaxID=1397 RepID=UPI001560EB11|nr:hypothetical protein [Niallia circulans]NRG30746.1 hypothetical protein [Niallia circulans]
MSQFKFGMDAIEETNASGGGSTGGGEFAKLPSGTSLKVKLTGLQNVMRYYGYGVFKKVNTFIAKNPSDRNEKGFVEANHTPWDLASKYYYDKAYEMVKDVTDEAEVKAIKESAEYKALSTEGFKYSGKRRYAVGFIDLEVGKEIVLDFTKKQFEEIIKAALVKFDAKRDKVAFEIEKTGARQDTKITITPVLDMDDDLTDKERANFEKFVGKEFNVKLFEGLLFEADEKTQTENLVAAGFDISLIGLTVGAGAQDNASASETDPTKAF